MVKTIECLERDFDIRKNPLPDVASSILEECKRPAAKRARQCNSSNKEGEGEGEEEQEQGEEEQQEEEGRKNVFLVKPTAEARGHTGFLTFACKTVRPPATAAASAAASEEEPAVAAK